MMARLLLRPLRPAAGRRSWAVLGSGCVPGRDPWELLPWEEPSESEGAACWRGGCLAGLFFPLGFSGLGSPESCVSASFSGQKTKAEFLVSTSSTAVSSGTGGDFM